MGPVMEIEKARRLALFMGEDQLNGGWYDIRSLRAFGVRVSILTGVFTLTRMLYSLIKINRA